MDAGTFTSAPDQPVAWPCILRDTKYLSNGIDAAWLTCVAEVCVMLNMSLYMERLSGSACASVHRN